MATYSSVPSTHLEILEFNDEQLAKMGAALQALVDEIPDEKYSPNDTNTQDNKDIIELLSDSDCEEEAVSVLPAKSHQNLNINNSLEVPVNNNVKTLLNGATTQNVHQQFVSQREKAQLEAVTAVGNNDNYEESTVHNENSYLNCKFTYDEPKNEMSISEQEHSVNTRPSIATYITFTDISGEEIQVKELNAFNDITIAIDDIQIQEKKHKIEEESKPQSNCDGMICVSTADYPSLTLSAQCTDSDEMGGNVDSHDFIDLVDSDTENESETKCDDTYCAAIIRNHNSRSIDCFIRYYCPQCGVECGTFADWKLHVDAEHHFNTIESLNMKNIINKRGKLCYQCRDCKQNFELTMRFGQLLQHRVGHLSFSNYLHCALCAAAFRNKQFVQRHLIKMHNKEEYLLRRMRPGTYTMQYIKIMCPICRKVVASHHDWKAHLEIAHDFSTQMMSNVTFCSNDVYNCEICGIKLRKRSIMEHSLCHQPFKSFTCTYCNKYEATRLTLAVVHVNRAHIMSCKERVYKCYYCLEGFKTTHQRNKHVKSHHMHEQPKCAVCAKEFVTISKLLSHMNIENHYKLK